MSTQELKRQIKKSDHPSEVTMKTDQFIIQKLNSIEALLLEQKSKPLNFQEASNFLDISPSYLYKLTSQKKIPHYKPQGKRVYFDRAELSKWLLSNPV